ncbi:hypothetical protein A4X09_0g6543 [Tilletia walkeri]|uniref:DDE-1 domain-containing protein n=1 Tax=Tilletia walkeri TaxID=117179 RepID=A0A8X7N3L5_9BASI|nr:hypothetical protein A4X09_0g6543 [Tilletia walkeri]
MVVHRRTSLQAKSGKKKVQLRTQEKIRILNWMKKAGRGQTEAARHFQNESSGIKQPLISEFVKRQENIRKLAAEEAAADSMRSRQVRCPKMGKKLGLWITQVLEQGLLLLNGAHIIAKAKNMLDALKTPDNKRPALSIKYLIAHWQRHSKELSRSGVKQDKFRLTVDFCENADGTERMAPIIIGKTKKLRFFNEHTDQQLGFDYYNNKTAWMTGLIFFDWLMRWNEALRKDTRRILLLVENFSGHTVDTSKLPNIQLQIFKPNFTAHVQPRDSGIVCCFKAKDWTLVMNQYLERYEQSKADFYVIDQLVATQLPHLKPQPRHLKLPPFLVLQLPNKKYPMHFTGSTILALFSVPQPSRLSINELLNPIQEEQSRHSRSHPSSDDNGLDLERNELGGDRLDEDGCDDEIKMVAIEDDERDESDKEDITAVAPTPLRASGMVAGLVDFTAFQTDPFFRNFARKLRLCKQKITDQRQEAMIQPRIA